MPAIQRSGLVTGQARTRMRARLEVLLVSEKGKKTSVYVGDPIQRVKQRLRDADSPLTLSARLNQIAERYMAFVVDKEIQHFTASELNEIGRALQGVDITPSLIRGLDSLISNDRLAQRIHDLSAIERLMIIERIGF